MKRKKNLLITSGTLAGIVWAALGIILFCSIPVDVKGNGLYGPNETQQAIQVTGTVKDAQGVEIPGVNVFVKGTTTGTTSGLDGKFSLQVPPNSTLVFSYIGYVNQEIRISRAGHLDVVLEEDSELLTEVIVTGVAKGISKEKLSFTVEKISKEAIKEVPGVNVATALAGKMPGIKVFAATGNPTDEPVIQLRGTTSFTGNPQPLIIVDGIITSGVLKDINMEDVESIEVIKGAAAASFYGSKAANGVVHIITKRGSSLKEGSARVSLKTEIGVNWIGFLPEKTTAHGHALDENGRPINGVLKDDQIWDNPYIMDYDSYKDFFTPRTFNSTTVGLTGRSRDGDMNYYTSFQYTHNPGVIKLLNGTERNSFRVNLDHKVSKMLSLSTSTLYVRTINDNRNINFDDIYYADPNANFLAENLDGTPYKVNPNIVSTRNNINPLYDVDNKIARGTANRFLGNYGLRLVPTDWLSFTGNYSIDFFHYQNEELTPKGRLTVNYPDGSIRDNGYVKKESGNTYKHNIELGGLFTKTFGDFNTTFKVQYLYEDTKEEGLWGNGSKLAVSGMNNTSLELADAESRDHHSWGSRIVSNSYLAMGMLDYKDKYIFDALIRRDGSSVVGNDNMWKTYFRVSAAWNVVKDFKIPEVQYLKPRISFGTAGILPKYGQKYETFDLSNGIIYGGEQLGNSQLKSALSQELETGIDVGFLDRFGLSVSYSYKRNTNLPYTMTVSGVTGFQYQHINIGEFFGHSYEVAFDANIIRNKEWSWDVTVTWDKLAAYIGELGRPDFMNGYTKFASHEKWGELYATKFATSLDHVKTSDLIKPGQSVEDVFTINNYGYVVRKDQIGTRDEAKMFVLDEDGNNSNDEYIGNMNPDFNMNMINTLAYKNWTLYFILSWQQGGMVYNNTKVYMSAAGRNAAFWDMSDRSWETKKSMTYLNQHARGSFTEDATFLKMRELAINYQINSNQFKQWGIPFIHSVKLGVVARNLFTLTKYSGPDPETRTWENDMLNGSDTPKYPSDIRTVTGTISIEF